MRIALVTPWPDDRSGIADYAYGLARGLLRDGVKVTVFTLTSSPKELPGALIFPSLQVDEWPLNDFDMVVYHVGNNIDFHGHQLDLLKRFPGVVHLHDYVLQHLFAAMSDVSQDWPVYFSAVQRLYGADARDMAMQKMESGAPLWEQPSAVDYPMSELFLENSIGAIVHSKFVRDKIRRRLPYLPVVVMPQVYPDDTHGQQVVPADIDRQSHFHIGVFGHVEQNRCIDQLLLALQDVDCMDRSIVVRTVGPCPDDTYNRQLDEIASKLPTNIRFEKLGFATPEQFQAELEACDLCVALRNPTFGETSAVVSRAMKLGKPLIVTRNGWYAELPTCVAKIDPGSHGTGQLAEVISRFLREPNYQIQISTELKAFADTVYNFSRSCDFYIQCLHQFHRIRHEPKTNQGAEEAILTHLVESFQAAGLDSLSDQTFRTNIYRRVDVCFDT